VFASARAAQFRQRAPRRALSLFLRLGERDALAKLGEPDFHAGRWQREHGVRPAQDLGSPLHSGAPMQFGVDTVRINQEDFLHGVDLPINRQFDPAIVTLGARR
jgi:hypothetical protein